MAYSSSFRQQKYQVFLSFRGEDTRNNFTSHLLKALKDSGIDVFFDSEKLETGEELSPALLTAVAASKLSIIVISNDYASSKACLMELSNIMQCKHTQEQIVVPIFYHVDPSDVRNHTRNFEESFDGHLIKKPDEVERWKTAFTEVGNLKGWHIEGGIFDRSEPAYIKDVVEDVIKKLNSKSASCIKGLVGINDQKEQIKSLLRIGEKGIRAIGIWGMGGIGKTTLAEAVYNEVSSQFESHCFLSNVREESINGGGIPSLRRTLFSKILKEENLHIDTPRVGSTLIMDRLRRKRVFIVLDDVTNDLDQLERLAVRPDDFGSESRMIVTSRDKQALENFGVDEICEIKELNYDHSLQLFSLYAFKQNHPSERFLNLSHRVLEYTKGVPIALKVVGSALYRRGEGYWESTLYKLKEHPNPKIDNLLKISFDGLEDIEKCIFLDVACFFKGYNRDTVTKILDSCYGYAALYGITSLIDKYLLNVTEENGLWMHDLVQDMGRNVVRLESRRPEKRSRLWTPRDVYHVLYNNLGTKSIEGMFLNMCQIGELKLRATVFERMPNLKFIKFYYTPNTPKKGKLLLADQDLHSLPNQLRYLYWEDCPFKSLPSNFNPENLVELILYNGNVTQLWNGDKNLANLRVIHLAMCKNLIRMPNLSRAKKLEEIDIWGCKSLVEFPSISHLISFEKESGLSCSNLKKFPGVVSSGIKELPYSAEHLCQLTLLNLSHTRVTNVSSNICKLESLRYLELINCPITKFPKIPRNLTLLDLSMTQIEELPSLIGCLKLTALYLDGTQIEEVPSSVGCLNKLVILSVSGTRIRNLPSSIVNLYPLETIYFSGCPKLTNFPNVPENIVELWLDHTPIEEVPSSISWLKSLKRLNIRHCKSLKSLPKLPPCLRCLDAGDCTSLRKVSLADHYQCTFGDGRVGYYIQFDNCFNLNQDASNNIVANALLRFQCMVKELVQEFNEGNVYKEEMGCCLPGSEISKKFEHQSTNFSIIVKVGLDLCSSRFMGFALCIVVDLKHHGEHSITSHEWLEVICIYQLKTKCGYYHPFQSRWICPLYDTELIHLDYSNDHVFILFDGQLHEVMKYNYEEALFEFHLIAASFNGAKENIKAAKCGVHVFYEDADSYEDYNVESGKNSSSAGEGEEPADKKNGCNSSLIQSPVDLNWLPSKL
ncbi:hypothetical protein CRYUN_Cryun23aG0026900 [Craigia yunnanensis]